MDISALAQAGFLPTTYFKAEKEMDTVLAPTKIDANGNVDNRSSFERYQAAGVDDSGTPWEGRVGGNTYGMMTGARFNFIIIKVEETVRGMDEKYSQTMNEIGQDRPQLAEKDWDFTINADNEIEIVEGEDNLSKSEIDYLQKKLDGLGEEFSVIADGTSAAYQTLKDAGSPIERYKYDLKRENFSEVFRGREFMNITTSKPNINTLSYHVMGNMTDQLLKRGADLKIDPPQDSNLNINIKV